MKVLISPPKMSLYFRCCFLLCEVWKQLLLAMLVSHVIYLGCKSRIFIWPIVGAHYKKKKVDQASGFHPSISMPH